MQIALDVMGGDRGSEILIQGALNAVREKKDIQIILLGPEDILTQQLKQVAGKEKKGTDRIRIHHATQVVGMDDSPVDAIRKKKDATIMVGFDLIKRGEADAVVSPGNSGATMAAAIRKLGRLPGISRPGIASVFPTRKSPVMMMDIGANVDCKPKHLLEFAIMASSYSQLVLHKASPRVGLLSNGSEPGKGNLLVKETHAQLLETSLNFIGNVEGRDVYQGDVDVVVCDGFVGNICLKLSEGLADAAMQMMRTEIVKSWRAKLGYVLMHHALKAFKKKVDYAEYGGAPLLGINGVGIVCHGASNDLAIGNAIVLAGEMVQSKVNETIVQALEQHTR